jgi:hypothetical protein
MMMQPAEVTVALDDTREYQYVQFGHVLRIVRT